MKNILAVAPHPDDETLGCGATLLKHKKAGDRIHWLIVTEMTAAAGYARAAQAARDKTIAKVAELYGFTSTTRLGFATTRLDEAASGDLVKKMGAAVANIKPDTIYAPHRGDVHTDHKVVFDAVASCAKWFRYPSVERVLAYETLSETDQGLDADESFRPNVFVGIGALLHKKIAILRAYAGELGTFPFPRSEKAVRALAAVRGAAAGQDAAEAFVLLRERA